MGKINNYALNFEHVIVPDSLGRINPTLQTVDAALSCICQSWILFVSGGLSAIAK